MSSNVLFMKKMVKKRRKISRIRLNSNQNFENFLFENDLVLKKLQKTVQNGNQLFNKLLKNKKKLFSKSNVSSGGRSSSPSPPSESCSPTYSSSSDSDINDFEGFETQEKETEIEKQLNKKNEKKLLKEKIEEKVFENEVKKESVTEVQNERNHNNDNNLRINEMQKLLRNKWTQRLNQMNDNNEKQIKPKLLLRKARLELSSKTLLKIRENQSFRDFSDKLSKSQDKCPLKKKSLEKNKNNKSGQPGFITCTICSATKYYSHVQRRHGVFSCEPCSKFFARFLKDPKQYFCVNKGDCPINDILRQTPLLHSADTSLRRQNVSQSRCKACWLKICLQKFSIDSQCRQSIANNFSPKLVSHPKVSLITVDTQQSPQMSNQTMSATTSSHAQHNKSNDLLMVVQHNKHAPNGPRVKRVCRSAGAAKRPPRAVFRAESDATDSDELPVDVYLCRVYEKELNDKKTKTEKKRFRCRACVGCLASDCGQCTFCLDKKKFGGQNVHKQACKLRTCLQRVE